MNVSLKMIICNTIIILLAVAICVVGVIGMDKLNDANDAMYEEVVVATEYIGHIRENFQEQRVLIQELALVEEDKGSVDGVLAEIETNKQEMRAYFDGYRQDILEKENIVNEEIISEENIAMFDKYVGLYTYFFEPELGRIISTVGNINNTRVVTFITSEKTQEMIDTMNDAYNFYTDMTKHNVDETDALYHSQSRLMIIFTVLSFIVSTFLSIYLPITVARPLRHMVTVADAVSVGDMELSAEHMDRGDEVGKLAGALERMKAEMNKQIAIVESLANADLTVEPELRSETDTLGKALRKLSQNLDQIITNVTDASDSVALESGNVAAQSQELAQGTTEQAASVEQLSSAFFEISLNTKESANLAGKAATVADDVRAMAVEGREQMTHMIEAVRDAAVASKNIDRIIKVIEEISFQTNILALNAAVEAAHAGQNGSGFAVVAAEVRSLASKSASSAKETGELIADALEKVELGSEIADQTSASFHKIVEGIMESSKLITDIAKSSEEQAIAIEQINTGISQVAQVIHINSEAAEKCAAAADRMNAQAQSLERSVSMFKTKGHQEHHAVYPVVEASKETPNPQNITIDLHPTIPSDDFGKY